MRRVEGSAQKSEDSYSRVLAEKSRMSSVVVNQSQPEQSSLQQSGTSPLQQAPYASPYTPNPAYTYMAGQQAHNMNMVVTNQPAPAPAQVIQPTEKPNPSTFIVTVILMSLCTFLGMVHLLLCFVPALILSVVGFNYGYSRSRELKQQSQQFTRIAVGLSIAAMVFFVLSLVIGAIVTGVAVGGGSSYYRSCGYYSGYYRCYY